MRWQSLATLTTQASQAIVTLGVAAGLFVGNDVGVLGVNVGEITAIEPDGDKVLVTMEIDSDQPVPSDAGAAVVAVDRLRARNVARTGGNSFAISRRSAGRPREPIEWRPPLPAPSG